MALRSDEGVILQECGATLRVVIHDAERRATLSLHRSHRQCHVAGHHARTAVIAQGSVECLTQ